MKTWEISSYQPAGWPEAHPAVIISSAARVAKKPELNVLMCSSKAATRPAEPNEVILDVEDGLSWPTLCKCDLIHLVSRDQLIRHYPFLAAMVRGRIHSVTVSTPRRVIPVIATKRVGCGTTEDFGAGVTGSSESNRCQNLLFGSNRRPASAT